MGSDGQAPRAGIVSITPHLVVRGAAEAAAWYERAFGAAEVGERIAAPDGRLVHLELRFGDNAVMLADEFREMDVRSPQTIGGTSVVLQLGVRDVDEAWRRAIDGGAESVHPLQDQFWGERQGQVRDPYGHRWNLATRVRDVPPDEIRRAAAELFGTPA